MGLTRPALVFVYNANSGLLNALLDMGHKVVSPRTYPCSLCALTYGSLGLRDAPRVAHVYRAAEASGRVFAR